MSPSAVGSVSGAPSGAPCPAGQPAGTYELAGFAGQSDSGLGHGTGGAITVTFTDGSYRMVARGDEPMIMEIPDRAQGQLFVNGRIDGTCDKTGAIRTFAVGHRHDIAVDADVVRIQAAPDIGSAVHLAPPLIGISMCTL